MRPSTWIVILVLCCAATLCRGEGGWMPGAKVRQTLLGGERVNQNSSSGPTLLQRVASGPRRVWTGTRNLVTYPFREKPQPQEPIWGQTRIIKRANDNGDEESGGFFSSMFTSKTEPKRPNTVTDWMKQPKPKF